MAVVDLLVVATVVVGVTLGALRGFVPQVTGIFDNSVELDIWYTGDIVPHRFNRSITLFSGDMALAGSDGYHVVAVRSTMLPGSTEERVIPILEGASGRRAGRDFGVAFNPEFSVAGALSEDVVSSTNTVNNTVRASVTTGNVTAHKRNEALLAAQTRHQRLQACHQGLAATALAREAGIEDDHRLGLGAMLDGLDGRIARLTGTTSEFGLEFDSLADIVSFGLAPALLAYHWALRPTGRVGWLIAFLYVVCAAMRLARYNTQNPATIDRRWFVGLPSPMASSPNSETKTPTSLPTIWECKSPSTSSGVRRSSRKSRARRSTAAARRFWT